MGRQQDGLPGRSPLIQLGPDLHDVQRRDGLEEHSRPGVVDVVHFRVMPGQPVVEAFPSLHELGGRRPERWFAGDRQHRLVQQEGEVVMNHPARIHDAVPESAEVLRRDASLVQLFLHLPDNRAQSYFSP